VVTATVRDPIAAVGCTVMFAVSDVELFAVTEFTVTPCPKLTTEFAPKCE
jgi:hypothetical protein